MTEILLKRKLFSNSCAFVYIDFDLKDVLIGQIPNKTVKVFRKIEWVSNMSKFYDNVFYAGLHDHRTLSKKTLTKFLMENFDRVNGHLELADILVSLYLDLPVCFVILHVYF